MAQKKGRKLIIMLNKKNDGKSINKGKRAVKLVVFFKTFFLSFLLVMVFKKKERKEVPLT